MEKIKKAKYFLPIVAISFMAVTSVAYAYKVDYGATKTKGNPCKVIRDNGASAGGTTVFINGMGWGCQIGTDVFSGMVVPAGTGTGTGTGSGSSKGLAGGLQYFKTLYKDAY